MVNGVPMNATAKQLRIADGDSRGGAEGTVKTFGGRASASGRAVLASFPTSVPLATICEPFLFSERWAELA